MLPPAGGREIAAVEPDVELDGPGVDGVLAEIGRNPGSALKISNSEIRFFRFPVYLIADRVVIAVVEKGIPPMVPANNVVDCAFVFKGICPNLP